MAGLTPSEALDAFVEHVRRAVRCVATVEVRGSGQMVDRPGSLTFIPRGGKPGNTIPLRTRDGRRDLRLGIYLDYTIVRLTEDLNVGSFQVISSRYLHELVDLNDREIFAYHWHPTGVSPIRFPQFHVSGAAAIPRSSPHGADQPRRLAIDHAHFPTGEIGIEEVVALLIRVFAVEPRRADWQDVLEQNLGAWQSGRPRE